MLAMLSLKEKPTDHAMPLQGRSQTSKERGRSPEIERFLRYCVVGASSFLVGLTLFNIFLHFTGRISLSNTLAFALSVVNGFIWNRRWTFRDKRGRPAWEQAGKFAVVNTVGYGLSQIVIAVVIAACTVQGGPLSGATWRVAEGIIGGASKSHYSLWLVNGAGVIATAVVVGWNFLANKCWSFRH